jgi:rhodanese-related sulfurtransferase
VNGGRKKWELEKRELVTDVPAFPKTNYAIPASDESVRAYRREVENLLGRNTHNLVDVRSPDEFTGKVIAPPGMTETAQRGGHIPGAKSIPWAKAVNDDGTFKAREELEKLYKDAGVDFAKPTIAYCRIGERSSHTWFVMKYLLVQNNVKRRLAYSSITHAGYPAELEKVLPVRAINSGVSGNTSRQGLARIERDVLAHKPDVVVVLFGTNDMREDAPRVRVSISEYETNLTTIITRCRASGAQVIIGTMPPLDAVPYFTRHVKEKFDAAGGHDVGLRSERDLTVRDDFLPDRFRRARLRLVRHEYVHGLPAVLRL